MTKSNLKADKILNAAGKLFRDKGFSATTVRDIANHSNILLGSLHYQYKTKDDILEALMERGVSRAIEVVSQAFQNQSDTLEKIRLGLGAHLKLLCDEHDPSLHVFLYDFRSTTKPARRRLEKLRAKYEAFWDGILQEAVDAGWARQGIDVALIRQFGFGALNWVPTWYSKKSKRTPQQIADEFFQALTFGLLRPIHPEIP
jgi:TetR/AcrR family transcriptional regulator, cholesterol catabolism regulator